MPRVTENDDVTEPKKKIPRETLDRVTWRMAMDHISNASARIVANEWNYEKIAEVVTKQMNNNEVKRRTTKAEDPTDVVITAAHVRGIVKDLNQMHAPLLSYFGFVIPAPDAMAKAVDEDVNSTEKSDLQSRIITIVAAVLAADAAERKKKKLKAAKPELKALPPKKVED